MLCASAFGQDTYYWQQVPVQANIANLALPQLGINQSDQIVGQTQGGVAFIASNGIVQTLGTFGGATSNAHAINDFGVASGAADTGTAGSYHPYTSNGGALNDLGTLNGGAYASSYDINYYGDVVGQAIDGSTGQRVGYISLGSGGAFTSLGTLAGSNTIFASTAYGVNNNDEVVGASTTSSFGSDAFSWTFGGGMVDLGTLGGSYSASMRVNDNGDIAGYATLAGDSITEAFLYSNGSMQEIDGPSGGGNTEGMGLNLSDQMVGLYTDPNSHTKAFINESGSSYDLNNLLKSSLPGGVWLAEAYAINDNGDIAAMGSDGYVYLLTTTQPAPEPATLIGLAGFGGLLWRRRKQAKAIR